MTIEPIYWLYAGFGAFVILFMGVDLALTGRGRVIKPKQALTWTAVCVSLALAFIPALYWMYDSHWLGLGLATEHTPEMKGAQAAAMFFQGWLLEYSLSVDNLFVFAVIFQHFKVPKQHQHRVLAWGIIATLILRGVFILLGSILIERFHFLLYVAGAFLIYTAFKMLAGKEDDFDADGSKTVRAVRRLIPVTSDYHGDRFFVKLAETGARAATPMFLVLAVLNIVDIVFAVDSIPAIFGITQERFIIFTSNVFAVLGLRALYFVLAHMMDQFKYLNVSLAIILGFVGVKMLTESFIHIPKSSMTAISLGFIIMSLVLGIWFSIRYSRRQAAALASGSAAPEIDQSPDE